jgi:hypothetical protein
LLKTRLQAPVEKPDCRVPLKALHRTNSLQVAFAHAASLASRRAAGQPPHRKDRLLYAKQGIPRRILLLPRGFREHKAA